MAVCKVCGDAHHSRGFCGKHFHLWKTGRLSVEPDAPRRVGSYAGKPCLVYGCDNLARDGAMCGKHAQRVRRYGDPHYRTPDAIRRANNRAAQPALRKLQRQTYPKLFGRHEHRHIAEQKIGRPLAKGEIVHHIDGNKHNNHPDNLQVMTQSEHIRLHQTQGDMPRD